MAQSGREGATGRTEQDSKPTGTTFTPETVQTVTSGNVTETDAIISSSSQKLDPAEEYHMKHKKRGVALIFNQERFSWKLGLHDRSGSSADRDNLFRSLKGLGFDVKAHDNLKLSDLATVIAEAAQANHASSDCFLCVFLSHGENDHVYTYDGKINIQEIVALFKGDQCKSLVGKPKIFIFQACRGDKHDNPVVPEDVVDGGVVTNQVVVDAAIMPTLPAGADFLMCYSVAEGYYSHRETIMGSWYIQDLCEVLRQHGSTLEFVELLTLVNRKVSMRHVTNCVDRSAIGKKQVPCFASMLTKKLYFRPKSN